MKQVVPFLRAVSGVIRSGLGYWLLLARCKKLSVLPDQELYNRAWQYSQKISWLLSGRAAHANCFRFNWQNSVVLKLSKHITGTSEIPEWMINLVGGEHAIERPKTPGQLILCTHTRLTYAIISLLKSHGHDPVLVRSFIKRYDGNQSSSDISEPRVIIANTDVLLNIRKASRSGQTVVALPDFSRRKAKTLFHGYYFSTSLIEFAIRSKIEIVFAAVSVTQNGKINIHFDCPKIDLKNFSADAVAEQLRNFIANSTGKRPEWELVESPQKIETLKHQLRDFCIE